MKKSSSLRLALTFFALVLLFSFAASAETTQVLPKGRSSVNLSYMCDPILRQFDDTGANRELGYQLNHVDLTDIGNAVLLEKTGPLPFPILKFANTFLEAQANLSGYVFSYQYGVTDNLSVGVGVPYFDRANTRAVFGVDVGFTAPAMAAGIDELILASTTPIGIVQTYLHDRLGYDRIKDWEGGPGVGDVVVGAKYRFLNQEMLKSAVAASLSIPTGKPDDERNVMDIGYGSGSYITGLNLIVDLVPVEGITWNMSYGYTWDLPYHRAVYMLDKSDPVFYNAEFPTLHQFGMYDRGDFYTAQTSLRFEPAPGIQPYVGFTYMQSRHDTIDGDVMPKTDRISRTLTLGLSASTVPAYQEKKAKLPMVFEVYGEPIQGGKNVVRESRVFLSASLIF